MWNDRDCNEKNYFLCERPMSDGRPQQQIAFCFSVHLTNAVFFLCFQNQSKSHGQWIAIKQ